MPQNDAVKKSKYHHLDPDSWPFKLYLVYDIFMVFIIIFNLFCLGMNFFLMSNIGGWFFSTIHLSSVLEFYRGHLHPWVISTEAWFIIFLIVELLVRWGIAIINRHHQRWFFFPFIHWYEVLAIIPHLRFLRLFRAGSIAYRLYEMGYQIFPASLQKQPAKSDVSCLSHTFEGKRYDREHSLSQQESISFCLKPVLKDLAEESFHPPSHLQTAKHAKYLYQNSHFHVRTMIRLSSLRLPIYHFSTHPILLLPADLHKLLRKSSFYTNLVPAR